MPEKLIPCLECIYAEALENEPNIKCLHPLVKKFNEKAEHQGPLQRIAINLEIKGPRGGWPFNFSPEWIESCNGSATEKPEEPISEPEEAKDEGGPESTKVEETEKVEEETPTEAEKEEETVAEPEPEGGAEEKPPEPEDDSEPFTFGKRAKKKGE